MILDRFPQIRNLSKKEKFELVGELWNSITESDYPDITHSEKKILDERYASYNADPRKGMDWEQLRDKLK